MSPALPRIARRLVEWPGIVGPAVRALESIGAHTLADHLDRVRSGGDLVAVPVPHGTRALRSQRLRM